MRALALLLLLALLGCGRGRPLRVGSKVFVEGVLLGELAAGLGRREGLAVEHRRGLGGTRILWNALLANELDVYPEYTGTIAAELLAEEHLSATDEPALRRSLARRGVRMSAPLGFDDGFALALRRSEAARLGLRRVSELRAHPSLALGFSHEFLQREDGWPGLRARYGLPHTQVRGLVHELAYEALRTGAIEVTDAYTTDAEVVALDLALLEDDLHQFPPYRAVWLYRADLPARAPRFARALEGFAGRLPTETMARLNARVRVDRQSESSVASAFLAQQVGADAGAEEPGLLGRLARRTREHLFLVLLALALAVPTALPLGVLAAYRRRLGALVLGLTGLVQTIPSLALLVVLIPLLGIGARPAVVALWVYSLLPLVRNTAQGLLGIAPTLRESALALGLPWRTRLWRIELPLAAPSILAGLKTATVLSVGNATLGALVGAGGYGEPILTGIRLAHTPTILEGALPAAALALATQALFALAERWLVPAGLRGEGTR